MSLPPFLPPFLPRYMGLPTFMRMPLWQPEEIADIGMVGVPFDGGVTNRPGARHGPRELRNQSSLMRAIHPATRRNPFDRCRIADMGDIDLDQVYDLGVRTLQPVHQLDNRFGGAALHNTIFHIMAFAETFFHALSAFTARAFTVSR